MWKKMIPESAKNESKKIPSNILIIGVFQEADTKADTADFWEKLEEEDLGEWEWVKEDTIIDLNHRRLRSWHQSFPKSSSC